MCASALITGITGQDGSYLAELLLKKGYEVHGLVRSTPTNRIGRLLSRLQIHEGDVTDSSILLDLIMQIRPDEIYNLAAQSSVTESWRQPLLTMETTGLGAVRLLEAIRVSNIDIKFFQASSCEMFGNVGFEPQDENTRFLPTSPYGAAKVCAHLHTTYYREKFGIFACSGIMFNHESPRRPKEFVTRKITKGVADIIYGITDKLLLGNLDAARDWGFAGDYVQAMWLILQHERPDDYVVATGVNHTVRELVNIAFERCNLDPERHVHVDSSLLRHADIFSLRGNANKARDILGWVPKVNFPTLIHMMVDADLALLKSTAANVSQI